MDKDQEPRSFEDLSEELLEAFDEVLDKQGSMKTLDDLKRIYAAAGVAKLYEEWAAAFRDRTGLSGNADLKYADAIKNRLARLGTLRKSLAMEGGRRKTRRRKYTRRYCKTTPCRRMGFTQKASCRPYKNCYRKSIRS